MTICISSTCNRSIWCVTSSEQHALWVQITPMFFWPDDAGLHCTARTFDVFLSMARTWHQRRHIYLRLAQSFAVRNVEHTANWCRVNASGATLLQPQSVEDFVEARVFGKAGQLHVDTRSQTSSQVAWASQNVAQVFVPLKLPSLPPDFFFNLECESNKQNMNADATQSNGLPNQAGRSWRRRVALLPHPPPKNTFDFVVGPISPRMCCLW